MWLAKVHHLCFQLHLIYSICISDPIALKMLILLVPVIIFSPFI